jgi:hypothetical protein
MTKLNAPQAMLVCLEEIRKTHPELIADSAPDGWGMNRFREEVSKLEPNEVAPKPAFSPRSMPNKQIISDYLTSRGVTNFVIGYGRFGATGEEITIEDCTQENSDRLQAACEDVLISRGGGGMAGKHVYRQISADKFSDPVQRALQMLEQFERDGCLPMEYPNDAGNLFKIQVWNNDLVAPSGLVVYPADDRTKALEIWLEEYFSENFKDVWQKQKSNG